MLLGPFDSDQHADYRQMIEVNLLGAITTTEVFPDQLKDGGGDIINISSVAGRTARSGNGVYAATSAHRIDGQSDTANKRIISALCIQDPRPQSSRAVCGGCFVVVAWPHRRGNGLFLASYQSRSPAHDRHDTGGSRMTRMAGPDAVTPRTAANAGRWTAEWRPEDAGF